MAGGGEAVDGEDVRTRTSREYEADDYGLLDSEGDEIREAARSPSLDGARTLHSDTAGTTSLSAETSRLAGMRKSDDIARATRMVEGTCAGPHSPLSIDTNAAMNSADQRLGESGSQHAAQHQDTSRRSPSFVRSRNRGMSLRTSLFTRNVDQRSQIGDSIIEMRDVALLSRIQDTPDSSMKSFQTAVSVDPVTEDLFEIQEFERVSRHGHIRLPSSKSASTSRNGLQGLSALPNYQQWVQERASRHLSIGRMKEAFRQAQKYIFKVQEIPPSKDGRHISLDVSRKHALIDDRTGLPFPDNFIKSSKYTPWNFVPRQLFAQFSKLANLYFLVVAILQMIPGLSTTGTYTTIIPLMTFISISMGKEGYEDIRRHRLDKAENNREASVLRSRDISDGEFIHRNDCQLHWSSVKWQALRVGDIVKIGRNEAAPADILLMDSKSTNNVAYIETMALDGETNLKPKQPSAALAGYCRTAEEIANLEHAEVVVEDPNLDLYNLEGKLSINGNLAPLTNNEVLYRGSILRNTAEAIGVIVYSGEECKIRMNANKHPRVKAPSLQAVVNKIVIFMVLFVLFLALFNTIAYQFWHVEYEEHAWYLTHAHVAPGPILVSFIIMFHTMIPLSLYVSMEIIKISQMFFMNGDMDMYDEASNTPFEARTSTINEELGQVNYIFSDKTGTLTENVMAFRKMSVAGAALLHEANLKDEQHQDGPMRRPKPEDTPHPRYPFRKTTAALPNPHRVSTSHADFSEAPRRSTATWRSAVPGISQPELTTADMFRYIQRHPQSSFSDECTMMIVSMALCHTCLPERNDDHHINYQASSPDELALVQAASDLGMVVYDRAVNMLTIKTFPDGPDGQPVFEQYEILDVIEFSSSRKRMSVIGRFPDGRICVMSKGADSVITERLRLTALAHQKIAEIEQRVSDRRSVEVQEVLRRGSEHADRRNSVGSLVRTSISVSRVPVGRSSFSRLAPIEDDANNGGKVAPATTRTAYTPRPSTQLARHSAAYSDHVRSPGSEAYDEASIENAGGKDESAIVERCFQHINDFATEGLRTLLYGHRFVSEDEYRSWKKGYQEALTSLDERQKKIEAAAELIEQQLELTGATAIEDKLQQGVPETIERLRQASIKLWMLTGDKRETAITIGHSCRLIKESSTVVILDHTSGQVERRIASTIVDITENHLAHSVIVIDGRTLGMIQADASLHTLFVDLAVLADSVICCRASPSQKAHLVRAIRRRVRRCVTLAIGDGANDIAMIQEAHVGIGITGREGLQAARSADYTIAQFRFLNKLLLVHGHWNYVRVCKYTLATFWKEMLFFLTQAMYQRWNGYTGTSLYEKWSLSQFNTLFTSLPVIFLGIFEQDLAAATLIAVPQLYGKGQRFAGFNFRVYFSWIFMAASEAMIVFFTMRGLWGQALFTQGLDLYSMGDLTLTACIIIINSKIQLLEQRNRTIIALVCICVEIGGWFVFNTALSGVYQDNNEYDVKDGFLARFGRNALWWACLLITVAACLLYEMLVRTAKTALFPTDIEIFQQLEKDDGMRREFEEASASELRTGWGGARMKRKEDEVQDLLDRPRVLEQSGRRDGAPRATEDGEAVVVGDEDAVRRSTDIQEMLSRRFGSVRAGELVSGQPP